MQSQRFLMFSAMLFSHKQEAEELVDTDRLSGFDGVDAP